MDRCHEVETFAVAVERLCARYSINAVFLATDDPDAFQQMRELLPDGIALFWNPHVDRAIMVVSAQDEALNTLRQRSLWFEDKVAPLPIPVPQCENDLLQMLTALAANEVWSRSRWRQTRQKHEY